VYVVLISFPVCLGGGNLVSTACACTSRSTVCTAELSGTYCVTDNQCSFTEYLLGERERESERAVMAPQQVTSLLCLTIVILKYGIALFHTLQGLQQDLTAYLSSLSLCLHFVAYACKV